MPFCAIVSFKGHTKTLGQFTYMDADINDVVLSFISNMSLFGIVSFISHTKTLGQFTYMDADINEVICHAYLTCPSLVLFHLKVTPRH